MLPSRTAVTMPPVPTTGPGRSTKRVLGAGRSFLAAALCAQVAHVVLYGSIFPTAGAHEYFRWYIPLVAVLSLCGLALVPVSIAASVLTRGRISSTALLPERAPGDAPNAIARLALSSAAFLLLQESIERTAVSGSIQTVTFSPLGTYTAKSPTRAIKRLFKQGKGGMSSGRMPGTTPSTACNVATNARGRSSTRPTGESS